MIGWIILGIVVGLIVAAVVGYIWLHSIRWFDP